MQRHLWFDQRLRASTSASSASVLSKSSTRLENVSRVDQGKINQRVQVHTVVVGAYGRSVTALKSTERHPGPPLPSLRSVPIRRDVVCSIPDIIVSDEGNTEGYT